MKRVILVVLALTGILAMADVPEAAVYVDPEYDRIWFEGEPEYPNGAEPTRTESEVMSIATPEETLGIRANEAPQVTQPPTAASWWRLVWSWLWSLV